METRFLRYIWQQTRGLQIWLSAVIVISMPFYFYSLELPKRIINGPIQGKGFADSADTAPFLTIILPFSRTLSGEDIVLFEGFRFGRLGTLVALSLVFLVLVILNGWFKLYINNCKGRIGERVLRQLRYEMIDRILRFPVWHTRQIKGPEIAGIVKDEVDPLSDFIGDSYSAPLFLAGQALTGLAFLFLQNVWFGLLTIAIVSLQVVVIPRLRRQLIGLGQQRQVTARDLAGRIGEIVQGTADIHLNHMSNAVRADVSRRLAAIFDIRLELFRRKFTVKFLNNLLMQFISVLFYLIGGYFVIRGRLDVGSLVASIAAYKDLPTPIKGLIDWDQQRLLSQVRFAQAVEAFRIDTLPVAAIQDEEREAEIRQGFRITRLTYRQKGMPAALEGVTVSFDAGERVAVVSQPTDSGARLLEVMARLLAPTSGSVLLDGAEIQSLPESVTGRAVGYVDGDTFLASGTIRDRLVEVAVRSRAGGSEADLARHIRSVARRTAFYDDICRIGLNSRLSTEEAENTGPAIAATRTLLRRRLEASGLTASVEPFQPDRYLEQASIAENIVFGMAVDRRFAPEALPEEVLFAEVIETAGLMEPLLALGLDIARAFTRMFESVSSTSVLFDAVATMTPERIARLRDVVARVEEGGLADLGNEDRRELLALALDYDEPGYRFALLDDVIRTRILEARNIFRKRLRELDPPPVRFHDPDAYDASISVLDNVLFGRIATRNVAERGRLVAAVGETLQEAGLWDAVFDAGLAFHVGVGGRGLSDEHRQKLRLARALMKDPDMLILNRACAALPSREQRAILAALLDEPADAAGRKPGMVCLPADAEHASLFDRVVVIEGGIIVADGPPAEVLSDGAHAAPVAGLV